MKNKSELFLYLFLVTIPFILYFNTISHDYALDDAIVITQNSFVKKGFHGIGDILSNEHFTGFFGKKKNLVTGGRYRPLSLVTFAIEYHFFGLNPHISHFINIILYIISGILLFKVLSVLLKEYSSSKWYSSIPFITTILFLTHPVHTEAVANIKGRDEILCFLFVLLAILYVLKYISSNNLTNLILFTVCFFMALLSKETAVTFLLIIPLTLLFFVKVKLRRILIILLPLFTTAFLFFFIRQYILGDFIHKGSSELLNNPFLNASLAEKYATIFYTLGVYIKLLIYPHPLTYDYYPYHIPLVNWNNFFVIVSFLFYLFIGLFPLYKFKNINFISYCILFYLISLSVVSNLFVNVGTFMNERFVYIPSLGYCLLIAYIAFHLFQNIINRSVLNRSLYFLTLSLILLLYSYKTISRNTAWKDDLTLFTTDVKVSVNSAKSNCSAGGKLIEYASTINDQKKKMSIIRKGTRYLEKAIEIYPTYIDALLLLGNSYYDNYNDLDKTISYYKRILLRDPNHDLVYKNLSAIFNKEKDYNKEIVVYKDLLKINPNRFEIVYRLGYLYGRYINDLEKSVFFLEKALKMKPDNLNVLKDLGVAYGLSGEYLKSAEIFEHLHKTKPSDYQVVRNLAITYQHLNNIEKARYYLSLAKKLEAKQ